MDTDQADPAESAALREAFAVDDGGDPARFRGPPVHGLVGLAEAAKNQQPAQPFPLTRA
ncbi:hypothetical protein [Streptomyces sp. NPDC058335]|uniref:hypothetical protein n=1 Tax=Streptomyces sp. NPDC058335 TaxID=3346451 RepID=UPI00365A95D5